MDFSHVLTDTYTLLLLIVLTLALVGLSLYYGLFYLRVGRYKNKKLPQPGDVPPEDLPGISVVLTTHNEGAFLRETLLYLLEQDYPNFEVVVVNYTSTDDTEFVLKCLADNYSNLKVIPFPKDVNIFTGKKLPLSIGIKSAKHDLLLLTEPDACPKCKNEDDFKWIRHMVTGFLKGADIVMGHCGVRQDVGLLNGLMQYDNLDNAASMFGWAILGNPYTATGRNLGYRRSFFFNRGGFIQHYQVREGADDMFVNQNANKKNTAMVISPEAYMTTDPRSTFGQWHQLRYARYATKKFYSPKDKMLLLLRPLMVVLFYLSGILLALRGTFPWPILLGILVLDWVWQIICFAQITKRFERKVVHAFAPVYEIYFLFANTILYFSALFKKK